MGLGTIGLRRVALSLGLLGRGLHVAALTLRPAAAVLGDHVHVDARHGLANVLGDLGEHLRVVVVRDGLDDRLGALLRAVRLEDAAADKDSINAELHAERRVGRSGNTAGREVDNREAALLLHLLQQVQGRAHLLGQGEELVIIHGLHRADLLVQGADVARGLDDVAGAGLALRADHAAALGDAPQGLAEVAAAAHEGHLELVFVHVVVLVRDREHLALVNAVDAEVLQHLRLHEVADAALGHDRDGHRVDNRLDHLRVRHAGDALLHADVCWDLLQGHHRARARLLGNLRLLRVHHVHDNAALEHRRQAPLHLVGALGHGRCGG
mmetsp:Transcript_83567/g.215226  ORF Transcript_83567/g.215226 Transcript_83567/m.215226 type:complete len:325 (+) Transcript_83567:498-1472(+)